MSDTFTVIVRGKTKQEVVRSGREKEESGYECIRPIQEKYITSKSWKGHNQFSHMEDRVEYTAVYRRKQVNKS